ncbi:hypothetical protein A2642_01470 [Candidatus Nomurabacteria bacterium RIFCSPHIGHO2_01_FULL_39_10]|uniref:Uncharacterized protein n=1 Tax=Candidatus Nomurabacteria bacterium RIFCSPHIGHO2_01_FULL_39_10 TaxID=1801733 RepID=A0A1F6V6F9_9BACT|nr:MAG: hypothetical protein A2642_01470 [Candidatus Nomurabacteria bacterium RIFCSPHIGHO2_01_FULL_39_10]
MTLKFIFSEFSLEIFSTKFQTKIKAKTNIIRELRITQNAPSANTKDIILISEEHIKIYFYNVRTPSKQCTHYNT